MREVILQAMREMLARHHSNPTLDEIAISVGITTRTVQDYFTSRTAIENELIAHLEPDNLAEHPRRDCQEKGSGPDSVVTLGGVIRGGCGGGGG